MTVFWICVICSLVSVENSVETKKTPKKYPNSNKMKVRNLNVIRAAGLDLDCSFLLVLRYDLLLSKDSSKSSSSFSRVATLSSGTSAPFSEINSRNSLHLLTKTRKSFGFRWIIIVKIVSRSPKTLRITGSSKKGLIVIKMAAPKRKNRIISVFSSFPYFACLIYPLVDFSSLIPSSLRVLYKTNLRAGLIPSRTTVFECAILYPLATISRTASKISYPCIDSSPEL
mmetsp:Transcript_13319/g.14724  ORF Transcript_13319/g.14724 Transcript_13319/m.14724 type:complete len:227 (+) Transcript_13319:469-1149(+)